MEKRDVQMMHEKVKAVTNKKKPNVSSRTRDKDDNALI